MLPFLFASGRVAIVASVAASLLALAGIGVATSLFNGRTALFSAVRQIAFAGIAAAVTYGTGMLLGVSLS